MKTLLLVLSLAGALAFAQDSQGAEPIDATLKVSERNTLDTNGYRFMTNYCKEMEVSGTLMIRNKNLDYDRNGVFYKTQRISYVIPDSYSIRKRRCYHEISTGINEVDMGKLMKTLD